jgi:hypothetical protein
MFTNDANDGCQELPQATDWHYYQYELKGSRSNLYRDSSSFRYRANHLALPRYGGTRKRRYGSGVQSRGH